MAAVYSKLSLVGSINGKQILISGSTSGSGTLIHTATSSPDYDEVWLYAYNDATSSVTLDISWGALAEPTNVNRFLLPYQSGRTQIIDGKLLSGGTNITAYASVPNVVTIDGYVNRIQNDASASIDGYVTAWSNRVVTNGGSTPSSGTLLALSTFVHDLYNANIFDQMIAVNCIVPDSLAAALTPLISNYGYSSSLWINVGFVSGDLTINGLLNDGTKYLKTGLPPSSIYYSTNDGGMTIYVYSGSGAAGQREIGSSATQGNEIELLTNYGGSAFFDCYNENAGGRIVTSSVVPNGHGFTSANRTDSTHEYMYAANSTTSFYTMAGPGGAPGSSMPTGEMYVFGVNNNAGGVLANEYSRKRISFAAAHHGLNATQAKAFFNAVQKMRQNLGGGYV